MLSLIPKATLANAVDGRNKIYSSRCDIHVQYSSGKQLPSKAKGRGIVLQCVHFEIVNWYFWGTALDWCYRFTLRLRLLRTDLQESSYNMFHFTIVSSLHLWISCSHNAFYGVCKNVYEPERNDWMQLALMCLHLMLLDTSSFFTWNVRSFLQPPVCFCKSK